MITAKVIADSCYADDSHRITTIHVRYPRMIHSEVMTHRVFSRNARSSRAVPIMKLVSEPAYVPEMGKNKAGMQSTEALSPIRQRVAKAVWLFHVGVTKLQVALLQKIGVHKQWANRLLEPFGYIDVLITSTEWDNFFILRDHPDAQPEIQQLAVKIREAMLQSRPNRLADGEWHLPYVTNRERQQYGSDMLPRLSTARCARISYVPFNATKRDVTADLALYDKLITAEPAHASPAEHPAQEYSRHPRRYANFAGWRSYRNQKGI